MVTERQDRRRELRYQALFPVSVILPDRGLIFGEALNVSRQAIFLMIGLQHEVEVSSEINVVMHLKLSGLAGAEAEKLNRGRVLRQARLNGHQGIAVFFKEGVDISLVMRMKQILDERGKITGVMLNPDCLIIRVSGDIEPKYLHDFEEGLSRLAFSVEADVVLDMSRVSRLSLEALDIVVHIQKLLQSMKRSLRVVCPRAYLQGDFRSDRLAKLVSTVDNIYPTLNYALAVAKELKLK